MTTTSLATQLMPTVSFGIALLCALSGCATIEPKAVEEVGFTSRAETQTKDEDYPIHFGYQRAQEIQAQEIQPSL